MVNKLNLFKLNEINQFKNEDLQNEFNLNLFKLNEINLFKLRRFG